MIRFLTARKLYSRLREKGLTFATAESLTGGLIGGAITAVPGSSAVYCGGIVSYSVGLKERLLGVAPAVISACGVVSRETAEAMARGVLAATDADISVAVTGVAGPGGGTAEVPAGTVWMASARKDRAGNVSVVSARHGIHGGRRAVRRRTVVLAMRLVMEYLDRE